MVYCCFSLHLGVDFGVYGHERMMAPGAWRREGQVVGWQRLTKTERNGSTLGSGYEVPALLCSFSVALQGKLGTLWACCLCTIHPTTFPQALLFAVCPGEGGRPSFFDWLLQLRLVRWLKLVALAAKTALTQMTTATTRVEATGAIPACESRIASYPLPTSAVSWRRRYQPMRRLPRTLRRRSKSVSPSSSVL